MKSSAIREVARIVLIDATGNVLLVRYEDLVSMDPEGKSPPSYWVPPGGALRPSESYQAAAARELEEETGLVPGIGLQVWEVQHPLIYREQAVIQREKYYVGRVEAVKPEVTNRTHEPILEHRWWSLADLLESSEMFFPRGFVKLVGEVIDGTIPSEPIRI